MQRHQWNALRVGDAVLLHTEEGELVPAAVSFVTVSDVQESDNAVGLRVQDLDETYYTWPAPTDVQAGA